MPSPKRADEAGADYKTSGQGHLYQGRFKSFPIQNDFPGTTDRGIGFGSTEEELLAANPNLKKEAVSQRVPLVRMYNDESVLLLYRSNDRVAQIQAAAVK